MQPLLVLGMHRSGTSLAASLLESAGLDVGQRLLAGNESNPRGHFEDEDFVEFEIEALRQLGANGDGWVVSDLPAAPEALVTEARTLIDRKQQRGRPWGWKDPRTVPLLPLWLPLLPGARFAMVYRAPWEVVESLYRRGDEAFGSDPELAVRVWLQYNQTLLNLALAAPERCVLSNVETIAAHPAAWVSALAERSGLPLHAPAPAIVEPGLLHGEQARRRADLLFRHFPEVVALFRRLEEEAFRPAGMAAPASWTEHPDAAAERRLALDDWAAAVSPAGKRGARPKPANAGWCACCRSDTQFVETGSWLRDQFLCERCQSVPRFRAVNVTLDRYFPGWEGAALHEWAPRTDFVRRHCARYSCSTALDDLASFAHDTFDLVVTQDVLEHVFQPDDAVREIMRTVKPGGAHVFTAPKHKGLQVTAQRARIDDGGVVTHLRDPLYHGDPRAADRELVTWDYGDDFELRLMDWCGIPTASYIVRDRSLGLDGEYLDVFVTRKPRPGRV